MDVSIKIVLWCNGLKIKDSVGGATTKQRQAKDSDIEVTDEEEDKVHVKKKENKTEALHIQKTPTNKMLGGRVCSSHARNNRISSLTSTPDRMPVQTQEPHL